MNVKSLLVALFLILTLSGCGLTVQQRELLSQYSSGARDVGASSAEEFEAMQEMVVQANKYSIVMNGMETPAQLQELCGSLSESNTLARVIRQSSETLNTKLPVVEKGGGRIQEGRAIEH